MNANNGVSAEIGSADSGRPRQSHVGNPHVNNNKAHSIRQQPRFRTEERKRVLRATRMQFYNLKKSLSLEETPANDDEVPPWEKDSRYLPDRMTELLNYRDTEDINYTLDYDGTVEQKAKMINKMADNLKISMDYNDETLLNEMVALAYQNCEITGMPMKEKKAPRYFDYVREDPVYQLENVVTTNPSQEDITITTQMVEAEISTLIEKGESRPEIVEDVEYRKKFINKETMEGNLRALLEFRKHTNSVFRREGISEANMNYHMNKIGIPRVHVEPGKKLALYLHLVKNGYRVVLDDMYHTFPRNLDGYVIINGRTYAELLRSCTSASKKRRLS